MLAVSVAGGAWIHREETRQASRSTTQRFGKTRKPLAVSNRFTIEEIRVLRRHRVQSSCLSLRWLEIKIDEVEIPRYVGRCIGSCFEW